MAATIVYTLCGLTALLCAALLLRAFQRTHARVLWWSGLCFCGLTVSNALLLLDKLVYTDIDLQPLRLSATLLSLLLLLYGLLYADE
jgi:hypothetical protein